MQIQKFEDIIAWQKSKILTKEIYKNFCLLRKVRLAKLDQCCIWPLN